MNNYQPERRQLTFGTCNIFPTFIIDDKETITQAQMTWTDCYNYWTHAPFIPNDKELVQIYNYIETINTFKPTKMVNTFKTTKIINNL